MAHFQEGSPERREVIEDGAKRLAEVAELQLESYREMIASKLQGQQREDFLRAFPVVAKMIIIGAATLINFLEKEEARR